MSLHWFPFYHADYLADTGRLSAAQHGVYLLLLLSFFKDGPLPNDPDTLCRIAAGATPSDVNAILQRYWVLTDEGWIQPKMDKVKQDCIARDEANAARALAGARARWDQKQLENASSIPPSNASSIPPRNAPRNAPGNAHLTSHISHLTDHKNTLASQESPKNSVLGRNPVPYSEIREAWIESLPELTKPIGVEHWTPNRKAQLAARWRDQLPDMDAWHDLFARINRSDFLMGRIKPFRCDLFWITRPENLLKLYEGKYDNATTASR